MPVEQWLANLSVMGLCSVSKGDVFKGLPEVSLEELVVGSGIWAVVFRFVR